jgi:hypothetical protein
LPGEPAALRPDTAAVVDRARELIAARSPEIASPLLDQALAAGAITEAERVELLHELVGVPDSGWALSVAAQRLRRQVRAAIARAAPALARPLLDAAVADERLTPAQEGRILRRLRDGQRRPLSSLL